MKVFKVLSLVALAMLVMTPAMATVINDGNNPATEDDLWQIYNTLGYGPVGPNSNLIPQVSPDEVFSLLTSGQFVATVHFAGNTEEFGFYQPVGGGPVTTTQILTVTPADGTGYINVSALIGAISGDFGFYLTTSGYGPTTTWYSESALNGGADHMIALATGSPDSILLAWEDLPLFGSSPFDNNDDSDYNDLVITFTRVVPEPTSMVLLGMGIAGAVVRRLRQKAA